MIVLPWGYPNQGKYTRQSLVSDHTGTDKTHTLSGMRVLAKNKQRRTILLSADLHYGVTWLQTGCICCMSRIPWWQFSEVGNWYRTVAHRYNKKNINNTHLGRKQGLLSRTQFFCRTLSSCRINPRLCFLNERIHIWREPHLGRGWSGVTLPDLRG